MRIGKYIALILILFSTIQVFGQKKSDGMTIKEEEDLLTYRHYFYEASIQKMLGNYNEAMNNFLNCLKINPESSAVMFEMSRILYSAEDTEGAIRLLEKAVKISEGNIWYNLFLLELYKTKSDYKSAIKIAENLVKIYPDDINYYFELTTLYNIVGKFSSSEKIYKELEQKFGQSTALLEDKVKFYLMKNDFNSAVEVLKTLIKNNPNEGQYLNVLSETYISKERFDEALEVLDELSKYEDYKTQAIISLAGIYSKQEKVDKYLQTLIDLFNQREFSLDDKVDIYVNEIARSNIKEVKDYKDSLVTSLVKTHYDAPKPYLLYADYLVETKDYEKAKEALYAYLKLEKSNYFAYEQLLYLENISSNYDSVLSVSQEAIELFPNQAMLYFYNGYAYYSKEEYNKAVSSYDNGLLYVTSNELRIEFYIQKAESLYRGENKNEAFKQFDRLLTIDPTNTIALNNYSYYLSIDSTNLNKALEMSILANNIEKDNYIYLDTYAWILYKMNRFDEALVKIENAVSLGGSDHSEILEHYGDILIKLGKNTKAVEQWKRALELDKENESIKRKIQENS